MPATTNAAELIGAVLYGMLTPQQKAEFRETCDRIYGLATLPTARRETVSGAATQAATGTQPAAGTGNRTERIIGFLTRRNMTAAALAKQMNLTVSQVQQALTRGERATPPIFIKTGQSYRLAAATTEAGAAAATAPAVPAARKEPPPGGLDSRVLGYVRAYPGCSRTAVIDAVAVMEPPARKNNVSTSLTRLIGQGWISGGKTGPYQVIELPAAQRRAA